MQHKSPLDEAHRRFSEDSDDYEIPKSENPEEEKEKQSIVSQIIEVGSKSHLFHDQMNEAHAAIQDFGTQKIYRIRGKHFRMWLRNQYYRKTGKAPNREALSNAIETLEAKAVLEAEKIPLEIRFARTSDAIWLDICDELGRAIKITAKGWEIVQNPPILFKRFNHQLQLPIPEVGGQLKDLLLFLNVKSQEDQVLILVWMVVSIIADIPRPLLVFNGPEGSAKTTASKKICSLLDPSAIETLHLSDTKADLAQLLDHHAIPSFDNLTSINGWQADILCKAVSGGGFSKRELYSDSDDVLLNFKRAIILTAINIPTVAPDLLDRFLIIELERLKSEERKEEAEILKEFQVAAPKVLGGILDTLSSALKIYPTIKLSRLPRMADFTRWGAAVAQALGYEQEIFLKAIFGNTERRLQEILEFEPVAQALIKLMADHQSWEGSPTELLNKLVGYHGEIKREDKWPARANILTRKLRKLQATLDEIGIKITFPEVKSKKDGRKISIQSDSLQKTSSLSSCANTKPKDDDQDDKDDAFAHAKEVLDEI